MHNRFGVLTGAVALGVMGISAAFWSGGCGISDISARTDRAQGKFQDGNTAGKVLFCSARPIWPKGRQTEKNLFVGFRAGFKRPKSGAAVLRITGSSVYRIFLNGDFLGHGPARGPHGYWRVDQWPLKDLRAAENVLAIEVAGYNVNSYYLLDQPSFIQAEIVAEGKVRSGVVTR